MAKRKEAATDPASKLIVIPHVGGYDRDHAESVLAERLPDWAKLSTSQRGELLDLVTDNSLAPEPVRVKFTRTAGGAISVEPDGNCLALGYLKLRKALATSSDEALNSLATEIMQYLKSIGAATEGRYNAVLAFVESMEPRDHAEAMLLVRHFMTHDAATRALSMIGSSDYVPNMQAMGNLASKLLSRADRQLETLARLRRGGEQIVKHIHIDNRGGQAVVAETVQTGGQNEKVGEQPLASGPTLLGSDPAGYGVPIAGDPGKEALPHARGPVARRAER